MKNITLFKTALLTAAMFGTVACNTETKQPEDTKKVAEEHNEAKFNTANKEKDAQFLVNAAEISMEEIKLGQLAQKNSTMKDVKDLGKMMETAHAKSLTDLTALAKTKTMTVPSAPTDNANEAYKKLSETSKKDFDLAYCNMMVSGHKDAVAAFEKASTESTDADIKQWATASLPILRTHLDQAILCQKKCEKMKM